MDHKDWLIPLPPKLYYARLVKRAEIYACKCYATFGKANNRRWYVTTVKETDSFVNIMVGAWKYID